MDQLLSMSSAWDLQYQEVGDLDQTRLPKCAEMFVTLMQSITGRYAFIVFINIFYLRLFYFNSFIFMEVCSLHEAN